jgi:hypothetical protein
MKTMVFRITTGLAGVYHLALGAAMWLLPAGVLEETVRLFLGTSVGIDPPMAMVAKFSSSYVLSFGIMLILLCLNPVRLRLLAIPALALFGIRAMNKLVLLGPIEEAFEVSRGRSLFSIVSLALIFGLIAFTLPPCTETRGSES